jgi:hypothetical protein
MVPNQGGRGPVRRPAHLDLHRGAIDEDSAPFDSRTAQLERILCAPWGGWPARAAMRIPQEHPHDASADRTRIEAGRRQRGELAADQAGIHLTATERRMRYERMQEGGVGLGPSDHSFLQPL